MLVAPPSYAPSSAGRPAALSRLFSSLRPRRRHVVERPASKRSSRGSCGRHARAGPGVRCQAAAAADNLAYTAAPCAKKLRLEVGGREVCAAAPDGQLFASAQAGAGRRGGAACA